MIEPITTPSATDKSDTWERCPIETLMYYYEQHQIQDEEDCHHIPIRHDFISMPNTSVSYDSDCYVQRLLKR